MARLTLGTALLALAAASVPATPAHASDAARLPDPTRPPEAAASAAGAAPHTWALQSVLVGRGRTSAAVISGQLVLLGGRVGDATLVQLTPRAAVLRGPHGQTTLPLTPLAAASTPGEPTR